MKRKIRQYVAAWEKRGYPDGIPDEAPSALERAGRVPSYRLICMAIMKNDYALQTLGYQRQPCVAYTALKRIELRARGVRVDSVPLQLGLAVQNPDCDAAHFRKIPLEPSARACV